MVLFDKIGLILFHFAWQAAVIAFISALLLFILKNASPKVRYTICCISMLLMVILPVCFAFSSLIKDPYSFEGYTIKQQAPVDTREVFDKGKLIGVQFRSSQIPVSFYEELMLNVNRYTPLICFAWMFGLLLTASYRIYGFTKIKSLISRSQPVTDSFWEVKIKELMRKTGIKQGITFLQSKAMDTPAVIGFFKPVLLIPVSFLTGIESRYIEAILLHELAHIKRYDYLINILQLIIETFGFFHPAVWWISSQIRKERENCCDDFAVEILGDKLVYAKSLVQLEEMRQNPVIMTAANGSSLKYRVSRLLSRKSNLYDSLFFNFAVPSIVIFFLIVSFGFVMTNSNSESSISNLFKNIAHNKLNDNLAAYLPFNGNADDESVSKQKTYTYNVNLCEDRFGRKNSAFDFNGKNGHIVIDRKNVLNNAKSITISCWICPRKAKNWETWICKTGKNKWISEWRMGFGENKNLEWGFTMCNLISGRNMWADYWITNTEIPLDKWTHVAVSADQDKHIVTVYTNGRKIGILKNLRLFDKVESPVIIGYQPDDKVYYDGKIDEIRIYNCALSDQEIREVFEKN
jgi:beta-lactamase regulating signal transducer with metallopeptidase domain